MVARTSTGVDDGFSCATPARDNAVVTSPPRASVKRTARARREAMAIRRSEKVYGPSTLSGTKLDDPFGARFGHINRPVLADGQVVHGVEYRVAGFAETHLIDEIEVLVELHDT